MTAELPGHLVLGVCRTCGLGWDGHRHAVSLVTEELAHPWDPALSWRTPPKAIRRRRRQARSQPAPDHPVVEAAPELPWSPTDILERMPRR